MTKENLQAPPRSEEAVVRMWDRCIADTTVKIGTGLALGALTSLLLFKRKPWPVIFGMGVGLGHGVANCQNDYKSIATMKHTPKQARTEQSAQTDESS